METPDGFGSYAQLDLLRGRIEGKQPGPAQIHTRMEARKWEDLAEDCLAEVFEKVGLQHLLLDIPLVCKSWHKASLLPKCWNILDFQSVLRDSRVFSHNDTKLVQFAVSRSCGTATRILLSDDCTMEGLQYIANECQSLKVLNLRRIEASEEERQCIPELIAKFKELQFLRIGRGFGLKNIVTQIGTSCPRVVGVGTSDDIDSEVASTLVHFLPNIKYLALRGCYIPRESLVRILQGCRDLVILDVRDCIGFDEDDTQILELASHVKTFMSKGSMPDIGFDEDDTQILELASHVKTLMSIGSMLEEDDCMDGNDYEDFTGYRSD